MNDPRNDPNYPAQWDVNHQRWFRQQYNYATQQWVFLDWLDASWPPPVAPAQPRRDSLHPRPSRRGNPVEGTYDKVNPTPHSNYEQLDPSFFVRDATFFQVGKLFAILFTESAGANALNRITDYNTALSRGIDHTALSKVKYNEVVHTQVRRFIVVKNKREFCYAVPIFTYSGQGTKKSGVIPDEHAIAYSYGYSPTPLPGEQALSKGAICLVMNEGERPLTQASRIYFGIHHPIQYNVKVKDLGYVLPDDTARFHGYWAMEVANDTQQAAEVTAEAEDD